MKCYGKTLEDFTWITEQPRHRWTPIRSLIQWNPRWIWCSAYEPGLEKCWRNRQWWIQGKTQYHHTSRGQHYICLPIIPSINYDILRSEKSCQREPLQIQGTRNHILPVDDVERNHSICRNGSVHPVGLEKPQNYAVTTGQNNTRIISIFLKFIHHY